MGRKDEYKRNLSKMESQAKEKILSPANLYIMQGHDATLEGLEAIEKRLDAIGKAIAELDATVKKETILLAKKALEVKKAIPKKTFVGKKTGGARGSKDN